MLDRLSLEMSPVIGNVHLTSTDEELISKIHLSYRECYSAMFPQAKWIVLKLRLDLQGNG